MLWKLWQICHRHCRRFWNCVYMWEYSQNTATVHLWCRSTVLKSDNLCDVSTALLILKVQVAHMWCKCIKSLSGYVNLNVKLLKSYGEILMCDVLNSNLLINYDCCGVLNMDLRLISGNLINEKHWYIIKWSLTKYHEIFPPSVFEPHKDRRWEYFILSQ